LYYNGVGLSTPRNQVPALSPSSAITAARAPALAFPALATWITQTKPRGFQRSGNIFAAAAQYRVEKARDPFAPHPPRWLRDLRLKPDKS
jgi:hypothetical protein